MNQRQTLITGSLLGVLAVALGAFGAHALKPMLEESGKSVTYELAIRYQFYHTLALIGVGILQQFFTHKLLRFSATCFLIGMILFSGSLFALCFLKSTPLALATPVGGLFLILGWALLAFGVARSIK